MDGWTESTIGAVCDVIAGQSPKGAFYNDCGEGLPFYQGKKGFCAKYIGSPTKWTTQVTREAGAGDVLMSVRAPVGPINFATQRICIGRGLAAIRANEQIDRNFLFYTLLAVQDQIQGNEGAVFASINKKQIENLPFSYPPLPEQERIVAILDEAFAAIAAATDNAEKNLANARESFEGYLNELFQKGGDNWDSGTLSDFVSEIATGPFGSLLHKSDYVEGGIPLINPINIIGGAVVADSSKTVELETYKRLAKHVVHDGDIVVARRGEIGRCAVIGQSEEGWICGTGCFVIRPSERVASRFLGHMLRSAVYREKLGRVAGRATMPNLSNRDLARLDVQIPTVPMQHEVLSHFEGLSVESHRLGRIYEQKLTLLTELKQSILHKAFTGELTADFNAADVALSEGEV